MIDLGNGGTRVHDVAVDFGHTFIYRRFGLEMES